VGRFGISEARPSIAKTAWHPLQRNLDLRGDIEAGMLDYFKETTLKELQGGS
jgi:hypothetical protein